MRSDGLLHVVGAGAVEGSADTVRVRATVGGVTFDGRRIYSEVFVGSHVGILKTAILEGAIVRGYNWWREDRGWRNT